MRLIKITYSAALSVALVAGCASVPRSQLTDTQAAITAAEALGAQQEPEASLHLKLAREQLDEAQEFIDEGENNRAATVLERAELDAELAMALARKAEVYNEAQMAWNEVQELQEEFGR